MKSLLAALLAAAPCVAVAQPSIVSAAGEPGRPLTLDQAIAAAGGSAPAAQAAEAGLAAAQAARSMAGLRPNPIVQTQVENMAGSGLYRGFDSAETTVNLSMPIELGGKRQARIAIADAQTARASLAAAMTQADIRLQVTQLYVAAVAAEQRLTTALDQARIASDVARAARIRVEAGRASPLEEQRADVARLNAEANMERARRSSDATRANLERRIGQLITSRLDLNWLTSLPPQSYGPAMPQRAEGTLALAAADADLTIADAGVRLAKSQRIPDLTVGPGVRRLEATNDMAAVLNISFPIPLFNAGKSAVAQASAERSRAEAQRRMAALDVEQAITDADADAANAAITARTASGPALAAAQEAARIARIGYREGKFSQLDLLDAERTLAETRTAAVDALAAYHMARAALDRLTTPAPEQGN